MSVRKLNCQKICEVLRLPTRVRIFQELIKAYKNRSTISKLQEITSEPRVTILFHINRFRKSNLVELDGPRRCFKVATRVLARLYGSGIQLEEME
jgi:DNA-binding transcriptional ArsR family regulator